ncbi:MAG: TolC family protein, partial [Thiobacillus sp.]|nr:TolC family protein [Thiobacillus sp.]
AAVAGPRTRAAAANKPEPTPLALRMDTSFAGRTMAASLPEADPLLRAGPFGPIQARPVTLLQVLELGDAGSTVLARGEETVHKAEAGVLGADNAFLPQFDLSAQLLRYGNKGKQATLIGSTVVQSEAAFYGSYAALSASINLYAGGRDRAGYRSASAELEAARADFENLRTRQFTQVIEQYTTLVKSQEEYRSLRQQESLYETQEALVATAYRRGQASRLDVNEARLQLSKQRQLALQQLATLEGRAGQLAVSLGLELPADERLIALEMLPEPPELPNDLATAILERAIAEHPALRAGERRIEAARGKVDAARAQYRPKVDLVGSYNWVGRDDGSAGGALDAIQANSYTVGLTLQQSLTPYTQKNAALQLAQAELREAEAQVRETRLGLWNTARQALAEVAQARAALDMARQAETDAGETLVLQRARLRHGRGNERALVEARANLAQRQLERLFQDNNYRLTGWAAHALLDPRHFASALLDKVR